MAIKKISPVMVPSTARGTAPVKDRLQKLLPPTDEAIETELKFWQIVEGF